MKILANISTLIIPVFVFYVTAYGLAAKIPVYDIFVKGVKEGLKTVVSIAPTMIGLMIAVGVLRASGCLEILGGLIGKITEPVGFPGALVPLTIVKMFSSSAATGLLLDVYKSYGPDSKMGLMASLMMSSTETIFYTMSVYFMTAKVSRTKWTLTGALIATFAGTAASVVLAEMM